MIPENFFNLFGEPGKCFICKYKCFNALVRGTKPVFLGQNENNKMPNRNVFKISTLNLYFFDIVFNAICSPHLWVYFDCNERFANRKEYFNKQKIVIKNKKLLTENCGFSQENFTNDFKNKSTATVSQQLLNNISNNTTKNNILYWAMTDMNNTSEWDMHPQMEKEMNMNKTSNKTETLDNTVTDNVVINPESSKLTTIEQLNSDSKNQVDLFNASDAFNSIIGEKIVLSRNNCNLEIFVQESQDRKIEVEFQKLKNNTSGKCCITLNGQRNIMLGVLISDIRLYQNASQGEVIKVIIPNYYGSDFILKEYYPWSKYQPLLLTETHKVDAVLYYEVKSVPLNEKNSHFNLEVFSYHKYENFIHQSPPKSHFSNKNERKNISESRPSVFTPYFL